MTNKEKIDVLRELDNKMAEGVILDNDLIADVKYSRVINQTISILERIDNVEGFPEKKEYFDSSNQDKWGDKYKQLDVARCEGYNQRADEDLAWLVGKVEGIEDKIIYWHFKKHKKDIANKYAYETHTKLSQSLTQYFLGGEDEKC